MIKCILFIVIIITGVIIINGKGKSKTNKINVGKKENRCEQDDGFDYIIAGGGTAGCVLASRLSEDPDVSVLLLEAGKEPVDPFIAVPRTWLAMVTDDNNWQFKAEPQSSLNNRTLTLQGGKVLGGSSAVNVMYRIRGSRHDFDGWEQAGNKEWGYEDVLPYFIKAETMLDPKLASNGFHGQDGPMEVKTAESANLHLTDELQKANEELGLRKSDDINGETQYDFGFVELNIGSRGFRSTTYDAYLKPVMGRCNLKVITEATVTKIDLTGRPKSGKARKEPQKIKASGVYYMKNGTTKYVKARKEIIVTAGTLNSPKILMLSGIGPKSHLQELKPEKIDVLVELPVGEIIREHIIVQREGSLRYSTNTTRENLFTFEALFEYLFTGKGLWSTIDAQFITFRRSANQRSKDKFPAYEILMGTDLPDGILLSTAHFVRTGTPIPQSLYDAIKHAGPGEEILFFVPTLFHTRTPGTYRLRSSNFSDDPIIKLNLLDNPKDIQDYIEAIRFVQNLTKTNTMKSVGATFIPRVISECVVDFSFDTDLYWECVVRRTAASSAHFVSTCRMGLDGVVDEKLRVRGVRNLRVADASVMPDQISGHTMSAVVMIAEKAAHMINQG